MRIIDVEKYNFSKEKLLQYGFREEAEKLRYRKEILDSSFLIEIEFVNSQLFIEVYDLEFDEIYSLYSVDSAVGETVQNIREHVEKLLSSILGLADESGKISSEIIDYCNNKYGENHANPFKKHPDILAFINEKNKLNDTSDYIGKEISEEDLKKINIENNGMIKVLDKEELNNLQIDTKNEKQTFAIDYKTEEVYYLEGYENDDDILYSLTDINKLAVE